MIWRDLTAFWNYPRQRFPAKWGAGKVIFPPSTPPPPQKKKKKFSVIYLRRELFPHCWDFLFLGVEALAPPLGMSVGRSSQYCIGKFILGEITANGLQPEIMRVRGRWKIGKVWRRGRGDEQVRERGHLSPIHA